MNNEETKYLLMNGLSGVASLSLIWLGKYLERKDAKLFGTNISCPIAGCIVAFFGCVLLVRSVFSICFADKIIHRPTEPPKNE